MAQLQCVFNPLFYSLVRGASSDERFEQISLGKGTLASVPLANIQLNTDMASKLGKDFCRNATKQRIIIEN